VPVGQKDHGGVPLAVGVALGRLDKAFHLRLGQVLSGPQVAVWRSRGRNCSIYGSSCDQSISGTAEMSGKIVRRRQAKKYRNATSRSKGRQSNDAYRVREHLTEAEMDKLLSALEGNRHGHRDWLIGLMAQGQH
jgi:hypothetical protein